MATQDTSASEVQAASTEFSSALAEPAAPRSRRRWLRFSLRTMLLVVTVLGVWLGVKVNQARRQKEAVKSLRELGATVYYAHQQHDTHPNSYDSTIDLNVPGWLRELAGDDFFHGVASVQFFRPVTDNDLVHLTALPEIEALSFFYARGGVTDAGMAHLPRPDRLAYFLAEGTSIGDEFVHRLAGAGRLESLGLGGTRITREGLRSLGELPKLKWLALDNTQISDAGLQDLPHMPSLESLQLDGTQVTDAGLLHVARHKSLFGVRLNRTAISDAGLKHLATLPRLRELGLGGTQVRGPGLACVARLLSSSLSLNDTPIDDDGLVFLKDAINLQVLYLEGTAITDAGLVHLHGLRGLSLIFLEGTQVTAEGIAKLTKAIPGLRIGSAPKPKGK